MLTSSFARFAQVSLLVGLASALPSVAWAGPVEQFSGVVMNAAAPDRIALRYENGGGGMLVSDDAGKSFRFMCHAAVAGGFNATTAFLGGDGSLWLGSYDGLRRDDGHACGWNSTPLLQGHWVGAVAAHPTDPRVLFVATSDAAPARNGLYRYRDGGDFEPQGSESELFITRLRVVTLASGELRFYESAVRSGQSSAQSSIEYLMRVSDDGGDHWTEYEMPLVTGELNLEAVDPTLPDRILISVTDQQGNALLRVSENRGAAFTDYLRLGSLGGLVIKPSGEVFIGSASGASHPNAPQGLFHARSLAVAPQLLSDAYAVRCLGHRERDDTLFLCDRFQFGTVNQTTGALAATVKLSQVEQFVQCPAQDVQAACQGPLLNAFCGVSHFPCAPMCDAYNVDLSFLASSADDDPMLTACLARHGVAATARRSSVDTAGASAVVPVLNTATDAAVPPAAGSGMAARTPGVEGDEPPAGSGCSVLHLRTARMPLGTAFAVSFMLSLWHWRTRRSKRT